MQNTSVARSSFSYRAALFGVMILTLGMGIGRFLYTPILPIMLEEALFSFGQLSWIASLNYAGYLVGSLLFSFSKGIKPSLYLQTLFSAALLTGLLIVAMAFTPYFWLVLLIRFAAGVTSAAMMIFGSLLVMQQTTNRYVIAALYAGVGVGILLGNEYVIVGLHHNFKAAELWLGAGGLCLVLLVLLLILAPHGQGSLSHTPAHPIETGAIGWWQLALLYGLAGLGYIITATYLPLMAKGFAVPLLAEHLWSLVGFAIIPGCFFWLWAAKRWGTLRCLSVNLVLQGICVLLTLLSQSLPLLILCCMGFGGTFMGTTSLVMPLARQLRAPHALNMLGVVTLTYGIGQIIGPMLTSVLQSDTNPLAPAVLCAALALFAAAGIALRYGVREEKLKS